MPTAVRHAATLHFGVVTYRKPDAQRTAEQIHEWTREATRQRGERIAWLVVEIGRLDGLIGEWSSRVPDGTPAPPQALALMVEKENLEAELRSLAGAPSYAVRTAGEVQPVVPAGASLPRRLLSWLTGRAT